MSAKQAKKHCCLDRKGQPLMPEHKLCPVCRGFLLASRKAEILLSGMPPPECGSAMPIAPARGKVKTFQPVQILPDGEDGYKQVELGFAGRSAMKEEDVFDRMNNQVRRKKGDLVFPTGLIEVARDYREITQRVLAGNVKCSKIEGSRGGGTDRDFMDRYMEDSEQLRRLHKAIGSGWAMQVRRQAAHQMDRGQRRSISDRELVDYVVLKDRDISSILSGFGWSVKGKSRKALKLALWLTLERMVGI